MHITLFKLINLLQIFSGLVQSNTTSSLTTKEIKPTDLERALANWIKYYAPQYSSDPDEKSDQEEDDELEIEGDEWEIENDDMNVNDDELEIENEPDVVVKDEL